MTHIPKKDNGNLNESASPLPGNAPDTQPASIVAECPPQEPGDLELGGVLCSISEKFLTPEHEAHIAGRGLLNPWARACCVTASIAQASLYLGYSVKSAGILFMGQNGQKQYRPDIEEKRPGKKKPLKYLSPSGEFDAFIPPSPDNPLYWEIEALKREAFYINDVPYILLTEGVFKALAGCSNGIPTISLLGVEQGLTGKARDPENQRFLVPALRRLAEAGFGFIIAFDADAATNPNVGAAEKKLAKQLAKFNVPVRSITGAWAARSEIEGGQIKVTNGMDDFIQHKGIEEFRAILSKAKLFGEGESADAEGGKKSKFPSPRQIAGQIAEDYGHSWKFDNEQKCWKIWSGKIWEKTEDGNFETLVQATIDAKNIPYFGFSYIADTMKLLRAKLRVKRWKMWDRKRYIAFDDLVLDVETGKTLKHFPGMGFTSHLPYKYKSLRLSELGTIDTLRDNCPNIYHWMNTAMQGSPKKILKLLAIINGLLKFRFFDLQMFVHLIGKPGSGKGTFIRLLQKIVGRENWKACKLRNMNDGSTMASIIDKQLVACPDERTATGVDEILSLTGGDSVSYREVYKSASDAFFYGLLIVGSNNPIFVGDTTGLDRRLCLVHFDNPLPTVLRNSQIEAAMDDEISQLIAVCLTLSDSATTQHIQGEGNNQIAEFKFQEWDMKLQTNSVAAHFDDCLIVDPTASISTGKLYEHYKDWCSTGLKAVSHIKYPKMLSELCNDYLELTGVKWQRSRGRSWFEGLRLRTDGESSPTHSDSLSALISQSSPTDAGFGAGFDGVATGLRRGSEPLPDGNYSHLRGLEVQNISNNLQPSSSHEKSKEINQQATTADVEEVGLNPVNPVKVPEPLLIADLNPASNPATTPQQPRQTPSSELNENELELVGMIQIALEEPDAEIARQAVADILPILKNVCASGAANREKVWAALTETERTTFSELTAKPIAAIDNPPEPKPPETAPERETIAPADAEKLREIASRRWDECYPAQMQSLLAQMYAWGAPGTRYDAATINAWLATEDAVTRKRIGELMQRRG
jgi:putative DNA primase/helicase